MDFSLTRTIASALTLAAALLPVASSHAADSYPNKPIRLIVPYAAGGPTDALARALADKMTQKLGEKVIVENKAGAGGNIGTAYVAKSAPDGYTMVVATNGPMTVNKLIFHDTSYDPQTELAPVALVTLLPNILAVHPSVPATDIPSLIALLKKEPGKYSYGSGGTATSSHFSGALFATMAGVQITHIPYKGDGGSMPDAVGGQIPIVIGSVYATKRYIDGGLLRGLAVTSKNRVPVVPDIPTMAEMGLPGYDLSAWYGIAVAAGTPQPIVNKLNGVLGEIMQMPDFRKFAESMGAIVADPNTPAQFGNFIQAEIPKWTKLVKQAGIKAQ
ncbi:Bug family tripartite tricarboxylate transporter substrate binding protein [Achromobacter aloeverae]